MNFGIAGKNGQINFALNFAQGDKRADVTQAPEVTVMNGQTGYFSDTSQTPFVVGAIPVVGGFPLAPQMQPPGLSPDQVDPRVQALLDAQAQAKADAQGGAVPRSPPSRSTPPRRLHLWTRPTRPDGDWTLPRPARLGGRP